MADTPKGTDLVSLGISVDATQPEAAATSLDKMGQAASNAIDDISKLEVAAKSGSASMGQMASSSISVVKNIDELSTSIQNNTKTTVYASDVLRTANAGIKNKIQLLQDQWIAEQAILKQEAEATVIMDREVESQSNMLVKLREMINTYGLSSEAMMRYKAQMLGITAAAEPMIAEIETLNAATAQYGKVITDVASIEAARIEFEKSAQTAFSAFKIRTMMDNRKEAMRILTEQEEAAVKLAEKQAIAEISWNATSVKARIDQLERLKLYQANSAISPAAVSGSFSSAAINDLPNLSRYQREYAESLAKTETATKKVKEATEEVGFSFNNARAKTEVLVLAHEALQGRYTRMFGSFMVLAEYTNSASLALTGMGLGTLAVVGTLGLLAYEMVKGIEQTKSFNDALNRTNDISGQTTNSLTALAQATGSVHGNFKDAYAASSQLAASGKFTSDQIGEVTKSVVGLNHAFGTPIQTSIKEFESLIVHGTSVGVNNTLQVTKALEKLDEQYHFVNASTMMQIVALEKEGKQREASAMAVKLYSDETQRAAEDAEKYIGSIEYGWNAVIKSINGAKQAMANIGKNSLELQRAGLQDQVDSLIGGSQGPRDQTPTKTQLDRIMGLKARYEELLDVKIRLGIEEIEANTQAEERRKQSAADHVIALQAIEDVKLLKKYKSELDEALAKNQEQLKIKTDANPDYLNDPKNAAYEQVRIEALTAAHTKKVAAIKNDGRKQDLMDELGYQSAQFKLVQDAYSKDEQYIQDAMKHNRMTTDEGYELEKAGRADELKSLTATTLAERAALDAYHARGLIDAAETKKRQDELTERYFAMFQKIMEQGIKANGQQADSTQKLYDDTINYREKDLESLIKTIAKQKEHNAEIGKSKDQIDRARVSQNEYITQGIQGEADALEAVLNDIDNKEVLKGKNREVYEDLLKYLKDEVKLRNENEALINESAKLDAAAAIQRATDESWKTANKKIGDDLAEAIVDGGGKGLTTLLHDMEVQFAKAILRPIIEPVTTGLASLMYPSTSSSVTNAAGAGSAGGAVGAAQAASNLYSLMSSGFDKVGDAIANGSQKAFNFFGTSDAQTIGNSQLAQQIGSLGQSVASLAAGHNLGDMVSGQYGVDNHGQAVVNIATAIGEYLAPGIGGAVGGVIGGLVNRLFGTGQPQVTHQGLDGFVGLGGSSIEGTVTTHTDGGLFRSDSNHTDYTRSADVLNTFNSALQLVDTTTLGLAHNLNLNADVLQNYSKAFDLTLTNDASANQKTITDFFVTVGDDMAQQLVPNLADFAKVGESASVTLQRLSDTFKATDEVANLLGRSVEATFGSIGLDSDAARERLVNLAGGIQNLTSEISTYDSKFLTDAEKIAPVQKAVAEAMTQMGYAGVTTEEQFKAIVNGLKLTTKEGAEAFQNLMAIAPAFAQVSDAGQKLADDTAKAYDNLNQAESKFLSAESSAMSAIQTAASQFQAFIDARDKAITDFDTAKANIVSQYTTALTDQQSAINARISEQVGIVQNYVSATQTLVTAQNNLIASYVKSVKTIRDIILSIDKTATPQQQYESLKAQFYATAAKAPNDPTAVSDLSQITQNFLASSQVQAASLVDFNRDVGNVRNVLNDVADAIDAQSAAITPIQTIGESITTAVDPLVTALNTAKDEQAKWFNAVVLSESNLTTSTDSVLSAYSTAGSNITSSTANVLNAYVKASSGMTSSTNDVLTAYIKAGNGLTSTTNDVLIAYNKAVKTEGDSTVAVAYYTAIADKTSVNISDVAAKLADTNLKLADEGNTLLTGFYTAKSALDIAQINLVAANTIRGDLELRQTTSLENFVSAIKEVNKTAQDVLNTSADVFTAASDSLVANSKIALAITDEVTTVQDNWKKVVLDTAKGIADSVAAMNKAASDTSAANLANSNAQAAAAKAAQDAANAAIARAASDAAAAAAAAAHVTEPTGGGFPASTPPPVPTPPVVPPPVTPPVTQNAVDASTQAAIGMYGGTVNNDYNVILNRNADASGLSNYSNLLANNAGLTGLDTQRIIALNALNPSVAEQNLPGWTQAQQDADKAAAAQWLHNNVRGYDVGTNQVVKDTFAMIHKDERIMPAADNRELMSLMNQLRTQPNNNRELISVFREFANKQETINTTNKKANDSVVKTVNKITKVLNDVTQGGNAFITVPG